MLSLKVVLINVLPGIFLLSSQSGGDKKGVALVLGIMFQYLQGRMC